MNRTVLAGLWVVLACARAEARLPQTTEAYVIPDNEVRAAGRGARDTIKSWPEPVRGVAQAMLGEYGPPTRFDDVSLVWLHNGPWEKTVVLRDGSEQSYLRQVIGYRVPPDKVQALMRFDPRVEFNEATNELAATSSRQSLNFLLLNIADDIVTEKLTTAKAREFYATTVKLAAAGKSSPYLEGLRFAPPNEKTMTP